MQDLPLAKVYCLIEPGPVILLTTFKNNRPNVMPLSWHVMMEFEPPLIGLIVSNRNYSFEAMTTKKECCINIPTEKLLKAVVGCGNTSGRKTDKFKKYGLTPIVAKKVKAPLIKECFASFECRVVDTRFVPKYCFFVVEVVKAWLHRRLKNPNTLHHRGQGIFMISGKVTKTKSRAK